MLDDTTPSEAVESDWTIQEYVAQMYPMFDEELGKQLEETASTQVMEIYEKTNYEIEEAALEDGIEYTIWMFLYNYDGGGSPKNVRKEFSKFIADFSVFDIGFVVQRTNPELAQELYEER